MERPRMGAHESSLAWRMGEPQGHHDKDFRPTDPELLKAPGSTLSAGTQGSPSSETCHPHAGPAQSTEGPETKAGAGQAVLSMSPLHPVAPLPPPRPGCQPLHQHLTLR